MCAQELNRKNAKTEDIVHICTEMPWFFFIIEIACSPMTGLVFCHVRFEMLTFMSGGILSHVSVKCGESSFAFLFLILNCRLQ